MLPLSYLDITMICHFYCFYIFFPLSGYPAGWLKMSRIPDSFRISGTTLVPTHSFVILTRFQIFLKLFFNKIEFQKIRFLLFLNLGPLTTIKFNRSILLIFFPLFVPVRISVDQDIKMTAVPVGPESRRQGCA